MTRKVYVGDTGGNVNTCIDAIKRKSEERINFQTVSTSDLIEHQLTNVAHEDSLVYFVPYLNGYQGIALYVNSRFVPKFDIDMFFNYKVMNQISDPVLYFVKHDAWLIDCGNPEMKNFNPVRLNTTDITNIKSEFPVTVINNI